MRLAGQRRVAETLAAGAVAVNGLTMQAGQLLVPNGTAAVPPIAFATDTDSGFAYVGGGVVHAFGGVARLTLSTSQLAFATELVMGGNLIRLTERADPSAPPANQMYIYSRDSGAAKTQLAALFNTGAVQTPAAEP